MFIQHPNVVYLITCLTSNKCYVGITKRGISRRWQGHVRDASRGSTTLIAKTIRKYGAVQFRVDEIFVGFDRAAVCNAEKALISDYGTLAPEGYNLTIGGEDAPTRLGAKCSEETKRKMSASAKGKEKSSEHRAALSAAARNRKISPMHLAALVAGSIAKNTGSKKSYRQALEGRIRRREEAIHSGAINVEKCNPDSHVKRIRWRSRISKAGKRINLGIFDTVEEASAAYISAAYEHLQELRLELINAEAA